MTIELLTGRMATQGGLLSVKYAYEDLSVEQFEDLIVVLCQRLLGVSVQGFSKGPDGGRDAKFVGTAERIPSKAKPWNGTVIIQAKHTNGYNKTFSESDFFAKRGKSSVIAKEVPRIKRLREKKHLDHYMLFSNRRLAANAESEIREHISKKTGVPIESIWLCGIEGLDRLIRNFPDVPKVACIDPVDSPLLVSPEELSEIVQSLATHRDQIRETIAHPPTPRVDLTTKNTINNMSDDYARKLIRYYLKEAAQIHEFLAAPENIEFQRLYESVIEDFQLKIIAKRKDYHSFDEVMNYLSGLLFNRDVILRQNKRLTRAILFYMYWNCDLGKTENATAN